uniref:Regulatory protein zeste n=1 Tax=Romanomermis culicivorax TaxID=13658 RepID=A0A915IE20_ROMCU
MGSKKKSSDHNFFDLEVNFLLEQVVSRKGIIESKRTDNVATKIKKAAWAEIVEEFHENPECQDRTIQQLQTKWKHLKMLSLYINIAGARFYLFQNILSLKIMVSDHASFRNTLGTSLIHSRPVIILNLIILGIFIVSMEQCKIMQTQQTTIITPHFSGNAKNVVSAYRKYTPGMGGDLMPTDFQENMEDATGCSLPYGIPIIGRGGHNFALLHRDYEDAQDDQLDDEDWPTVYQPSAQGEIVEEHKLPYERELKETKPCLATVRRHVATNRERPHFKPLWLQDSICQAFCQTIIEMWDQEPEARISAGCALQRLQSLENLQSSTASQSFGDNSTSEYSLLLDYTNSRQQMNTNNALNNHDPSSSNNNPAPISIFDAR